MSDGEPVQRKSEIGENQRSGRFTDVTMSRPDLRLDATREAMVSMRSPERLAHTTNQSHKVRFTLRELLVQRNRGLADRSRFNAIDCGL